MPLPLLALPIAAGFATASGGVSIGALIGSVFGGVAGGVALGGGSYWWYTHHKENSSKDHQESLTRQAGLTHQRIKETKDAVEHIALKLSKVAQAVHESSATTQSAVTQLNETASELHETGAALNTAAHNAKDAVGTLSQNPMEQLSPQLHEVRSELAALSLQLLAKEQELSCAQESITQLKRALNTQVTLGEQLNRSLETLCEENALLKETIAQQKNKIELLGPQMNRIMAQMRFFKQAALQHSQNESSVPTPETHGVN